MLTVPIDYTQDKAGIEYHCLDDSFVTDDPFGLTIFAGNALQVTEPHPPSSRYYNFYSIAYNIKGAGYFIHDDSQVSFNPGQVAIITPGYRHYYGSIKDKFVESFLLFTGPLADRLLQTGIIGNVLWEMSDNSLLIHIIKTYTDPSPKVRIQAKIDLLQLLMNLYLKNINKQADTHALVAKLIETIKADISSNWSITKMSKFCQLSEPHFRRIFKIHTSCAPKEYFERLKINQAAHQLIYSNAKIIDIATEVGFSDPYHFNRRFKKTTTMPPGAYRRLHCKLPYNNA